MSNNVIHPWLIFVHPITDEDLEKNPLLRKAHKHAVEANKRCQRNSPKPTTPDSQK